MTMCLRAGRFLCLLSKLLTGKSNLCASLRMVSRLCVEPRFSLLNNLCYIGFITAGILALHFLYLGIVCLYAVYLLLQLLHAQINQNAGMNIFHSKFFFLLCGHSQALLKASYVPLVSLGNSTKVCWRDISEGTTTV